MKMLVFMFAMTLAGWAVNSLATSAMHSMLTGECRELAATADALQIEPSKVCTRELAR
jgi:hypothetical protein